MLKAAIKSSNPFLSQFWPCSATQTTFKFHQAYEAKLNHKLAELKVEACQKKLAAFSAATETCKANPQVAKPNQSIATHSTVSRSS
jgi:hypothetical protein